MADRKMSRRKFLLAALGGGTAAGIYYQQDGNVEEMMPTGGGGLPGGGSSTALLEVGGTEVYRIPSGDREQYEGAVLEPGATLDLDGFLKLSG